MYSSAAGTENFFNSIQMLKLTILELVSEQFQINPSFISRNTREKASIIFRVSVQKIQKYIVHANICLEEKHFKFEAAAARIVK